jgi:putative colanic acid biosynthesis acetyltransferase WcaF
MQKAKTDLSSFENSWYKPGRSKPWMALWFLTNALFFRNPLFPLSGIKVRMLRLFGAKVGVGVVIKPAVNIKFPWRLHIGNHVWIGENVWIDNLADVHIGDHACISQGAMLLTGNHNYKKTSFDLLIGEIHLEEGVWIGAQTVVCPGIKAHSHALLTVGSIATSNLEAYMIYAGNPAQKIRERKLEA